MISIQALLIAGLVLVHLFAARLRLMNSAPRSRWLSMAGGISVAYVFMHVFPELAGAQERVGANFSAVPWLENHVYLVALIGLIVFYGLERMVKRSQKQENSNPADAGTTTSGGVFWLHISSFTIYNALIGYLLVHREEQDLRGLLFFAVAMGVHFLVNDYGLRRDHKQTYQQIGRWVLSIAIVLGWLLGLATSVSSAFVDVLFAFLAGGVVLNVLKEELPEERESRFWPFVIGAAGYTVLLLV